MCVGGARASPPEDCGGPSAYMELLDRHQLNWPHEELFLIAETLSRLLGAKEDENIRARLGNLDELQKAVERLEAYRHFRPDYFDRRAVCTGLIHGWHIWRIRVGRRFPKHLWS